MKLSHEQAEELVTEEKLTLADGRTLRLTEQPDYDSQIGDWDCYGQIETRLQRNSWGNYMRPAHFDGAAEIVTTHSGDRIWWQPYMETKEDRRRWHTDPSYRREMREHVRNILDFGFMSYVLTVSETCPSCDHEHEIDSAAIGGYEPFISDSDKIEMVHDLVSWLNVEVSATDA